ncbi:hypothetical protein LCGC14_2252470, partial [marine sediment metagenome]
ADPSSTLISSYDFIATLTVTNTTGSTLTDRWVRLDVNSNQLIANDFAQSDLDDLLLLDAGSLTLPLTAQIDAADASAWWIRVPSILNTNTATYTLHHGDNLVTPVTRDQEFGFDGTTDLVTVVDSALLDIDDELSVESLGTIVSTWPAGATFLLEKDNAYTLGLRQDGGNNEVFARVYPLGALGFWDGSTVSFVILDETANDNDGTGFGGGANWGPDVDLAPELGEAGADYDGVNERIAVPADATIEDIWDGGGSVELWVNIASDTDDGTSLIAKRINAGVSGWILRLRDTDGASVACGANLQAIEFFIDFDGAADGTWKTTDCILDITAGYQHVALVYDSDVVGNDPEIYLEAVAQSGVGGITETSTPVGTRVSDTTRDVGIGSDTGGGASNYEGQLDEVRMWSDSSGDGSDKDTECTGVEANLELCFQFQIGFIEVDTQDSDADTGGTQAFVTGTSYDIRASYDAVNFTLDIDGGTDEDTLAHARLVAASTDNVLIGTSYDGLIHASRIEDRLEIGNDVHANNNDGTVGTEITDSDLPGPNLNDVFGNNADFSGLDLNSVVTVPADAALANIFDGGGTVEFWVFPDAFDIFDRLVMKS